MAPPPPSTPGDDDKPGRARGPSRKRLTERRGSSSSSSSEFDPEFEDSAGDSKAPPPWCFKRLKLLLFLQLTSSYYPSCSRQPSVRRVRRSREVRTETQTEETSFEITVGKCRDVNCPRHVGGNVSYNFKEAVILVGSQKKNKVRKKRPA